MSYITHVQLMGGIRVSFDVPFAVFSECSSSRDLQLLRNPQKLEDDQGVQDGKEHDGANPIEDLGNDQVGLVCASVRYISVLDRVPATINQGFIGAEVDDPCFIEAEAGGRV